MNCVDEQLQETLSLCKHNLPVKFGCMACDLERQKNNYTLCGNCLEQVPTDREHPCRIIKNLKKKFDDALSAIQTIFNDRILPLEAFKKDRESWRETWVKEIFDRIEKLESLDITIHNSNLFKRIEKIENYIAMEYRVTASDVLLRLTELERFQDITNKQYQKVINSGSLEKYEPIKSGLTPHKCPVCDGDGVKTKVYQSSEDIVMDGINLKKGDDILCKDMRCFSCEGKGIVWG